MNELYYLSSRGTKVDLFTWPVVAQNPEVLLGFKWEFESTENKDSGSIIHYARQKMKEKELTVSLFCDSEQQFKSIQREMFNEFDFDIRNNSPGRIYWDNVYISAFVNGASYEEYEEDFDATDINLNITADKPFWIDEDKYTFDAVASEVGGLNYPHNYPHNYSVDKTGARNINIDASGESGFEMIVYGPCTNPVVNINGHPYSVTCNLQSGEYLRIDTRRKRLSAMPIAKVGATGTETSLFNQRNKTCSCLEKIKAGSNSVTWSGAFKFDLTVFVERSVPL